MKATCSESPIGADPSVQSPSIAFAALRDSSEEAFEARQEPVLALVLLAGFAGVLSTALAGRALDDSTFGGSVFAVLSWAFLGGAVYGLVGFWLGGLMTVVAGVVVSRDILRARGRTSHPTNGH